MRERFTRNDSDSRQATVAEKIARLFPQYRAEGDKLVIESKYYHGGRVEVSPEGIMGGLPDAKLRELNELSKGSE
jgi:hypothetical protein